MGYACPVCGDPQVDATHLANHVAFSALTGDESHEAWLDETVPEWGELGEDALGEQIVAYADEVDLPTEMEGGAGRTHDHDAAGERRGHAPGVGALSADDEETEAVLEEARELTRRMQAERADDAGGDGPNDDSTNGDDDSETE